MIICLQVIQFTLCITTYRHCQVHPLLRLATKCIVNSIPRWTTNKCCRFDKMTLSDVKSRIRCTTLAVTAGINIRRSIDAKVVYGAFLSWLESPVWLFMDPASLTSELNDEPYLLGLKYCYCSSTVFRSAYSLATMSPNPWLGISNSNLSSFVVFRNLHCQYWYPEKRTPLPPNYVMSAVYAYNINDNIHLLILRTLLQIK